MRANNKGQDFMIGTRLGSYEIIEEIGRGGMATVYRAFQPQVDRFVAIKLIRNSILDDPMARERFQREARLVARLEHPHLLPIYDFDGEHNPPYLVMRYLEGGTLKDILSQRQLPFEEIAFLIRQITSALDYAHRQGVVHRDIKPSNVMIDREGNAFLTDFGIARMVEPGAGEGITGTGAMIGTPDYMPPEQGQGATDVDGRADIYSLGVMFYQMLTGELPFKAPNPLGVIVKHINEAVPSATAINPTLPPSVDTVILRAMAKQPDDRYSVINEFTQAVIETLGGVVASTPLILQQGAQESIDMKLSRRAENLDEINATMARFAAERGESFTPEQSTPTEQQRQMTALQVDLTEMGEMLYAETDEENARNVLEGLWSRFGEIASAHGGALHGRSGQEGLILWGLDSTREDAPEQAIRAGLEMRDAAAEAAQERWSEIEAAPFRAGISTGLALVTRDSQSGSSTPSGATITLSAKVKDAANLGAVLVAYDTFTHVRGIFDFQPADPIKVKGRDPVEVFTAIRARPRAFFRGQQRGIEGVETAMVGREPQLQILQDAISLMLEIHATQVVTVVGEAGVGKSRLLDEFTNFIDLLTQTFWFFQARATQQLLLVPYSLTRDLFSFRFEIADNDPPDTVRQKFETGIAKFMGEGATEKGHYIAQLVGFDFSDIPYIKSAIQNAGQFHDQALRYLGEFFVEATKVNPVLIQIEDIHWADDKSLDLINNLVERNRSLPLFAICMARPSLYERRPTWGEGQEFHERIALEPLTRLNSRRLIREILKRVKEVSVELLDLIAERAEGNPFYIEELIKTFIEDRAILKGDDEWMVDMSRLKAVRVPATLTGVLQARLDSLPVGERTLLQRASVIGRVFWDTAVEVVSAADNVGSGVAQGMLKSLRERELIFQREETIFAGANEYIFRHAILRDVTYESIAPKIRRGYHALVAQWLLEVSGSRAGEYANLIADHYEKAGEAVLAAAHLQQAGEQVSKVGGFHEALALYERALALASVPGAGAAQGAIHNLMGKAHVGISQLNEAEQRFRTALELGREVGNDRLQAEALAGLANVIGWLGDLPTAMTHIEEAIGLARRSSDQPTLAETLRLAAVGSWQIGKLDQAEAYIEECHSLFEALGDTYGMANALVTKGTVNYMKNNMDQATGYVSEALAIARSISAQSIMLSALVNLGEASRAQGNYEAARQHYTEAIDIARAVGTIGGEGVNELNLGLVGLALNDLPDAAQHFRRGLEIAQKIGVMTFTLGVICGFGVIAVRQGRVDDGLALIGLALGHPSADENLRIDSAPFIAEIEAQLGKETVEAGMEKGKALDLDAVVKEIIVGK